MYAELQYESYANDKDIGLGPAFLLGAGPFFEHGANALGAQISACGWFIGVPWVRPCLRPALRTDHGLELAGYLHLQGYLEWYTSR